MGPLMASPIRRWFQNPDEILRPYIREGMTVLEPGPGMGFYTLPLARLVGETGKVIAVDVQPRMLAGLRRRAARAGLLSRIDVRQGCCDSMCVEDLRGTVDLVVAIAVVHEMPSEEAFFRQAAEVLKEGGSLLLMEPRGHVKPAKFSHEMDAAGKAGLQKAQRVIGGRSLVVLFAK